MGAAARAAVERVARDGHGRMLAWLARQTRDIAGAEDALADALGEALVRWSRDGVPLRPEAWVLTVARRRVVDGARRASVRTRHAEVWRAEATEPGLTGTLAEPPDDGDVPDERLGLMLAATHPAIDRSVHAPLILQVVLGLSAERMAGIFLVAGPALGQRLSRAKAKIRDAGVPFDVPARALWPERLGGMLDAVYAAYTASWTATEGGDAELAAEAVRLAGVLVSVLPDEPEVLGLRALLLHSEARRPARRDSAGRYVALVDQDPSTWDLGLAREANQALARAARLGLPGRFQIEAAIQGAMAARGDDGRPPWAAIVRLYDALLAVAPSIGAAVARAAALGESAGPEVGLGALDVLGPLEGYQPADATRAHLLRAAGRAEEARIAYDRAIAGAASPEVAAWLRARRP